MAVWHVKQSSQGEDDALMRYAQKWQSDVLNIKHCKSRAVRAIVTNTAGSGVFLPRYIFPLAPPADLMGDGAAHASFGIVDPASPYALSPMLFRLFL